MSVRIHQRHVPVTKSEGPDSTVLRMWQHSEVHVKRSRMRPLREFVVTEKGYAEWCLQPGMAFGPLLIRGCVEMNCQLPRPGDSFVFPLEDVSLWS